MRLWKQLAELALTLHTSQEIDLSVPSIGRERNRGALALTFHNSARSSLGADQNLRALESIPAAAYEPVRRCALASSPTDFVIIQHLASTASKTRLAR